MWTSDSVARLRLCSHILARLLPLLQDISHQGQNLDRQNTALSRKDLEPQIPKLRVLQVKNPPFPGWQEKCSASEGGGSGPGGSPRDHAPEAGCPHGCLPHTALHLPSSSRVKGRKVVSSFRFLLKSMHRRLSFFLMPLIF